MIVVRTDPHLPPGFIVIVILGKHQFLRFVEIILIQAKDFILGGVVTRSELELDQSHNGIVNDPDKFGNNAFPDFRNPLFFNTAYTVCFDIDLVGDGGRAEYSPSCPVVLHFLHENILTYIYHFIIFLCCIWHTLFIFDNEI